MNADLGRVICWPSPLHAPAACQPVRAARPKRKSPTVARSATSRRPRIGRRRRTRKTMNDISCNEWQRGQKWECLVCHTSQYDRKTDKFSHEGVSCESCHGAMKEDHPDKSKMVLPVTSEVCAELPCDHLRRMAGQRARPEKHPLFRLPQDARDEAAQGPDPTRCAAPATRNG
jgi:hypothetical protein